MFDVVLFMSIASTGTTWKQRRGDGTPSSPPAARGQCEGAALPHGASRCSSDPACRRCLRGDRRRLPCCRPRGGRAACWAPRAVVVVAKSGLLLLHLLPRPLELGFGGVEIHLLGLEACILLLEVGRVAGGAQIRRCEVRSIGGGSPVVDEKALAGGREVVDVVGVVLQAIPRENLKEVVQRGEIGPRRAREDDATRRLSADEVLQLELE